MNLFRTNNLILLLAVMFIVTGTISVSADTTIVSFTTSEAVITTDTVIENAGFFVNGKYHADFVPVSLSGDTITIRLSSIPYGMMLKTVVDDGEVRELIGHPVTIEVEPHTEPLSIKIHLSLIEDPNAPPKNPFSGLIPTIIPSEPEQPENPDTPGSDEPYRPTVPPAGSVYNLAGFIPLAAGFLLLFLVFFWRRKVYRILKSHAKKHGEKPEKEHLKEIADAIIKLVRDEGRYPEWKKNSDVAKRLSADIVSVLDEMNYPKAVPRGALVAEIIKAARGKINRHRL